MSKTNGNVKHFDVCIVKSADGTKDVYLFPHKTKEEIRKQLSEIGLTAVSFHTVNPDFFESFKGLLSLRIDNDALRGMLDDLCRIIFQAGVNEGKKQRNRRNPP